MKIIPILLSLYAKITGGLIDNTPIGSETPSTGAFTSLKVTEGAADGKVLVSDAAGNQTYVNHVPPAGTIGQFLTKASNDDRDMEWTTLDYPVMSGFFEIDVDGGLEPPTPAAYADGLFELDATGGLMPVTTSPADDEFDLDANDDIQPQLAA